MIKCKCMFRILTLLAIYIIFTTKEGFLMCFYRARGARSNLRLSVIFKHKRTTNCTAAGSTKYTQCSVGG